MPYHTYNTKNSLQDPPDTWTSIYHFIPYYTIQYHKTAKFVSQDSPDTSPHTILEQALPLLDISCFLGWKSPVSQGSRVLNIVQQVIVRAKYIFLYKHFCTNIISPPDLASPPSCPGFPQTSRPHPGTAANAPVPPATHFAPWVLQ